MLIWGRVRAADRFAVEGEYRRRLLDALAEAKVEIVTVQRMDLIDSASRMERPRRREADAAPLEGPQT